MPIVTATQVTDYTNISASAGTITSLGLINVVRERVRVICQQNFIQPGIALASTVTFNATAGTIVAGSSYVSEGFADDDEIYVEGSYRNDGYHTVSTVTTTTITITSATSVVDELSGATVTVSLVDWPDDIAYTAAQMVKYDYDDRKARGGGLASQSLGPRSEAYVDGNLFGYPSDILAGLDSHRRPTFG